MDVIDAADQFLIQNTCQAITGSAGRIENYQAGNIHVNNKACNTNDAVTISGSLPLY